MTSRNHGSTRGSRCDTHLYSGSSDGSKQEAVYLSNVNFGADECAQDTKQNIGVSVRVSWRGIGAGHSPLDSIFTVQSAAVQKGRITKHAD